jgi:hypothetical protein
MRLRTDALFCYALRTNSDFFSSFRRELTRRISCQHSGDGMKNIAANLCKQELSGSNLICRLVGLWSNGLLLSNAAGLGFLFRARLRSRAGARSRGKSLWTTKNGESGAISAFYYTPVSAPSQVSFYLKSSQGACHD